jgi:hypothetical protein
MKLSNDGLAAYSFLTILFDLSRRRPAPLLPRDIGFAPTWSDQDARSTLTTLNPGVKVYVDV